MDLSTMIPTRTIQQPGYLCTCTTPSPDSQVGPPHPFIVYTWADEHRLSFCLDCGVFGSECSRLSLDSETRGARIAYARDDVALVKRHWR